MEEAQQLAEAFQKDIAEVTAAVESEEGPLDDILQEAAEGGAGVEAGVEAGVTDGDAGTADALREDGAPEHLAKGSALDGLDGAATGDVGKPSVEGLGDGSALATEASGGDLVAPLPPGLSEGVPPSNQESVDFAGTKVEELTDEQQKVGTTHGLAHTHALQDDVRMSVADGSEESTPEKSGGTAPGGKPSLESGGPNGDVLVAGSPGVSISEAGSPAAKTCSAEPPPSPRRSHSSSQPASLRTAPVRAPRTPRAARTASQSSPKPGALQGSLRLPVVARPGSAHHSDWADIGSAPSTALTSQLSPRFGSPHTDGRDQSLRRSCL